MKCAECDWETDWLVKCYRCSRKLCPDCVGNYGGTQRNTGHICKTCMPGAFMLGWQLADVYNANVIKM